jgi:DNA modification methylase
VFTNNLNPKPVDAYYQTEYGAAYLGDSLELIKNVPDKSISLILTSPPFALTRKKEYGNKSAEEYVEWFLEFAREFKRVLKDDGSFVLDLGGAYLPGYPVRAIYQFELLVRLCKELGFFLAQDFYHYNPSRLPAPAEWVNIRRVRVKDSVNVVWWLSVTENPKANNRNVLKPYSESMKLLLENGYKAKLRPNLLTLANTESNSAYLRRCKEAGIKSHPARFPLEFPKFFIEFLTDESDIVLDPFAGSNTTGQAAELLKRRWLAFELDATYLEGSVYRFQEVNDLFAVRDENGSPQQIRPARTNSKRNQ